jgi:hypothetical protein
LLLVDVGSRRLFHLPFTHLYVATDSDAIRWSKKPGEPGSRTVREDHMPSALDTQVTRAGDVVRAACTPAVPRKNGGQPADDGAVRPLLFEERDGSDFAPPSRSVLRWDVVVARAVHDL